MAPGMRRGRPQPSQGAHTPEVRLRDLIRERCPALAGHRCLQTLARGWKRETGTRPERLRLFGGYAVLI